MFAVVVSRKSPCIWYLPFFLCFLKMCVNIHVHALCPCVQVRHMAGAILAVGRGRLNLSDISRMLEGGTALQQQSEERHAYTVADARGLCLERVFLPRIEDPDSHMKYDWHLKTLMHNSWSEGGALPSVSLVFICWSSEENVLSASCAILLLKDTTLCIDCYYMFTFHIYFYQKKHSIKNDNVFRFFLVPPCKPRCLECSSTGIRQDLCVSAT